MEAFGMAGRWCYVDEVTGQYYGLAKNRVRELCRSADIFVNVSCSTFMRDEYQQIPARALIDSDPMFTQIQLLTQTNFTPGVPALQESVEAHTHHFTFGEHIGQPDCRIPDCGVAWQPTRQPICLEYLPMTPLPVLARPKFSTVMNWTAARLLEFGGETWGQKDIELRKLLHLPQQVPEVELTLAVGQTQGAPLPDVRTAATRLAAP